MGLAVEPTLRIDFDEISFHFGGTDRNYTRARFIVDGQIVLEQAGDGKRPLQMHDVYSPVWSWKGKVGVLQFDDADIDDGFLAADHVQTTPLPAVLPWWTTSRAGGDGYGRVLGDRLRRRAARSRAARARARPCNDGRASRGDEPWRGADEPVGMRARPFTMERKAPLVPDVFDFGQAPVP